MKTVYAFGAGASIHAGYPLASKMGGDLLDFMLNYPIERYRDSAQSLVEIFGKSQNIEDLISEVEARLDTLKNAKELDDKVMRSVLAHARGHVAQMIREWFRILHNNPAPLYAAFADRIVEHGDTVITFNYDDSLEKELKRAGKWDLTTGYGFSFGTTRTRSEVLLLKLHGSINWIVSILGGANSGPVFMRPGEVLGGRPVIHPVDAEHLGYKDFTGDTYSGGGASLDSLILPGRCKRFSIETSFGTEFKEFWDALWSQGAEALETADRLVICGYSMPVADGRARELLLEHTKKDATVTVLSGNDSERIADDFRAKGFENVSVLKRGYFENLIEN